MSCPQVPQTDFNTVMYVEYLNKQNNREEIAMFAHCELLSNSSPMLTALLQMNILDKPHLMVVPVIIDITSIPNAFGAFKIILNAMYSGEMKLNGETTWQTVRDVANLLMIDITSYTTRAAPEKPQKPAHEPSDHNAVYPVQAQKNEWSKEFIQEIDEAFHCKLCPTKFAQLKNAETHVIHLHRVVDFACGFPGCKYKSWSPTEVSWHHFKKHFIPLPDSILERSKCPTCGKLFRNGATFVQHIGKKMCVSKKRSVPDNNNPATTTLKDSATLPLKFD